MARSRSQKKDQKDDQKQPKNHVYTSQDNVMEYKERIITETEHDIVEEALKITRNEVTHCSMLVELGEDLIKARKSASKDQDDSDE